MNKSQFSKRKLLFVFQTLYTCYAWFQQLGLMIYNVTHLYMPYTLKLLPIVTVSRHHCMMI